MAMFAEFKKFALRGNVVDLAIGVIIGAAFGAVVTSLVGDVRRRRQSERPLHAITLMIAWQLMFQRFARLRFPLLTFLHRVNS